MASYKNRIQENCKLQKSGFTIIEALIFVFILVISVLSFYQAFNVGLNYIIETKKKLGAVGIANEEIEKMRNLGYESLNTGAAGDVETIRNGITYYVTTNITNADDEEDGVAPADTVSWDYYRIGLTVKWDLTNPNKQITMNGIVVPPVIEKDADLGYMRLHVLDQDGAGLANAVVSVLDLGDNELVYSGPVDASGNLFLTGLDPGEHRISVTDDGGNFPVETLDESGGFVPESELQHMEIFGKTLAEKYIQTDKTSTLSVDLKDAFGNAISNLGFEVYGGKLLGATSGVPDYSFPDGTDPESVSSGDGTETFSDLSFGPYFFNFTDLNDGTTDYTFLWMTPISSSEDIISLDADTTLDAEAVLVPENKPSLLATVTDAISLDPVVGAQVKLQRTVDPLYGLTLITNDFGKVYFPEDAAELANEAYDLTVSATGYDTESTSVNIADFTTQNVALSETP